VPGPTGPIGATGPQGIPGTAGDTDALQQWVSQQLTGYLPLAGGILEGPVTTADLTVPLGHSLAIYGLMKVPAIQAAPGNDMTGSTLPPGVAQPLIQIYKPSGSGNAPALSIENFSTGNSVYIHSSGNPRLVIGPDGPITIYRPDSTAAVTINVTGATSSSDAAINLNSTNTAGPGVPCNFVMLLPRIKNEPTGRA